MKHEDIFYVMVDEWEYVVRISAYFNEEIGYVDSEFWGSPCRERVVELNWDGGELEWELEEGYNPMMTARRWKKVEAGVMQWIHVNEDEIIYQLKNV